MSQATPSSQKKKILTALKKARGSIQKAIDLLENTQVYSECDGVLVHVDSASGSLRSSRNQIIDHFIYECLNEAQSMDFEKLKTKLKKLYSLSR